MAAPVVTDALDGAVAALMRDVGATLMMPRFRQLAAAEIMEKTPGDFVTVVDRAAEALLTEGLMRLLPGSTVVGEEATAADPALLDRIGDGLVWIVDPLDGTGNYAAGRHPFAIMVALAADGAAQGGWILDPATGRLCRARLGHGAFVDDERIVSRGTGRAIPVGALSSHFLPGGVRERVERGAAGRIETAAIPGCAGEQYPRVALGTNDIALYWRGLPWDHAPGALFLTEAGGRVAWTDGTDYRADARGTGLIAAATPALWDVAAAILAD